MAKPNYPNGTRVAVYLRRSKEEHQAESLEVQRANAAAYCAERGWLVVAEYVDDSISRAEFVKRPGLFAMLHAAKAGDFSALVLRDESRLGGDVNRTGLVMQDLADAKIGIVYYYSDELVNVDGAVNKLLVSVRNFASEYEREKVSQRTYEHLLKKAKTGAPAGGLAYGYKIEAGAYVVHEAQAEVVRRIFTLYAAGAGQRGIAHLLNAEGVASPYAHKRGGTWSPSTVRSMLLNTRYSGLGRYNQTQKLYRAGTRIVEDRPSAEHVTYDTPRIIEPKLWAAVVARFARNPKWGEFKTTKGAPPRHLLVGLSRCAMCGGSVAAEREAYVCRTSYTHGKAACKNGLRRPMAVVNAAVMDAIKNALTASVMADAVAGLHAEFQARLDTAPARTGALNAEAAKLRRERARFVKLIAATDDPPATILEEITARDSRLREVELQLAAMAASLATTGHDLERLEREAKARLASIQERLAEGPAAARAVLTILLGGDKLNFTPEQGKFRIRGRVNLLARDCVNSRSRIHTVAAPRNSVGSLELSLAA